MVDAILNNPSWTDPHAWIQALGFAAMMGPGLVWLWRCKP